jgi:two-component system sensor histidine kinase RegB
MDMSEASPALARDKLQDLAAARHVTIGGLVLSAIVVHQFLGSPSPLPRLIAVIAVLCAFQALTLMRLRGGAPAGRFEAIGHLGFDVAALTAFFYVSGGATNPFVDLFLVPMAAAAVRFSRGELLFGGAASLAAYLSLVGWHVPLPGPMEGVTGFNCFGMWVKAVVCGGFLFYLIYGLAARKREDEHRLAAERVRTAADDYLARAGALALGAAHEIRSPLCTVDILVNEMLQRGDDPAVVAKNLRVASRQLERCRRVLGEVMSYGREAGDAPEVPVDRFLHELLDSWRVLRPNARLASRRSGTRPPPRLCRSSGLGHAILNLLNNAADASPESVTLECRWTASALHVQILDRGPGLPAALKDVLGERPLSKPGSGAGIGLLLAKRIVERAGGTLEMRERPGGGTSAELTVPLVAAAESAAPGAAGDPSLEIRYYGSAGQ